MSKERLCPECKGIIKPGHTDMVYDVDNIKITIKNVTANICSNCGQSFISGPVAEDVNRLVNRVTEDVNSFIKTQPHIVSNGQKEVSIAV